MEFSGSVNSQTKHQHYNHGGRYYLDDFSLVKDQLIQVKIVFLSLYVVWDSE